MAKRLNSNVDEIKGEDFEDLAQEVLDDAQNTFEKDNTVQGIADLVRRTAKRLDDAIFAFQKLKTVEIDCKRGCSWCCHEIVLATAPEIIAIYHHVEKTYAEEEKAALLARLEEYDTFMAPKRNRPFYFVKKACPFLVGSECSIYNQRPFVCRGRSSIDAEICRMWMESPGDGGIVQKFVAQYLAHQACEKALALGFSGRMDSARFELGRCLKLLFDDHTLAEKVLDGLDTLPAPMPKPKSVQFTALPNSLMPQRPEPPFGKVMQRIVDEGEFTQADSHCSPGSLPALFTRMRLPNMYSSYEQILESRKRMEDALDDLEAMDQSSIDLRTANILLHEHLTVSLPYQALPVKDLLEKQGRVFYNKIVSRAFPNLCEPKVTPRRPGKLRSGYMSGSIKLSNASRWALGWARNHSPEIETYAFNLGRDDIGSQMWAETVDHFYRLEGDMEQAASFIRALDLDAIIFTDIGYHFNDYILYSFRLARVQCTAWGTPVTSGMPSIDYYLSSELMEPPGAQSEYTEKLICMPRSGLCYPRPKSEMPCRPRLFEGEAFVPLMAQNLRKWPPQRDYLFKRIYDRHGKPLKIVAAQAPHQTEVVSKRLDKIGVKYEMLPFTNQINFAHYMKSADVSYDPLDWSGANTTIEALTYGVPVVTLPGTTMRARHSLAFLQIANAQGLIAKDEDDYIDLIFDRDRQHQAMKNVDVDALYEDVGVVDALDKFLLASMGSQ